MMRSPCSFDAPDNEHSVTEHSVLENPISQTIGVTWEEVKRGDKYPSNIFATFFPLPLSG
jgi:hypothetical protein